MFTRRLMAVLAMFGFVGLAACDGGGTDDADIIMEDTILQRDVETVEVPVETTDTARVRTEVDIDTAVDVDTIDSR